MINTVIKTLSQYKRFKISICNTSSLYIYKELLTTGYLMKITKHYINNIDITKLQNINAKINEIPVKNDFKNCSYIKLTNSYSNIGTYELIIDYDLTKLYNILKFYDRVDDINICEIINKRKTFYEDITSLNKLIIATIESANNIKPIKQMNKYLKIIEKVEIKDLKGLKWKN